jgi:hypothetical protein
MQVEAARGFGGALDALSGNLHLKECRLHRNVARMTSINSAYDATAGAISVATNAVVNLEGCRLSSNEAGGIGLHESYGLLASLAKEGRDGRSSHIHCAGATVIEDC